MIAKNIEIGKQYKHKNHPNYAFARAIKLLSPKEAENTNMHYVVKCELVVNKDDKVGLIKYFRPSDLMELTK